MTRLLCWNSCCRRRYTHFDLLARAWNLRDNITAYDAIYVVLAKALDATVVTCDRKLAKAPGHHVRMEVVE